MTISFARHQFAPVIIQHAVWLYVRFTLSFRDVEDLLANEVWMSPTRRCDGRSRSSGLYSPENFAIDAPGRRRSGISTRWP
jgi:hypothetical protein